MHLNSFYSCVATFTKKKMKLIIPVPGAGGEGGGDFNIENFEYKHE